MEPKSAYRTLPSVEKLISSGRVQPLHDEYAHEIVVGLARQLLDELRASLSQGNAAPPFEQIAETLATRISALGTLEPRPVINATGVIIHTNLGRAPMSNEAIAAMSTASAGYTNLEMDLATGKRGSRNAHIESLLCELTGAESALVVNNNASAVLLALSAIAKRKEVIVSRGHAVEIGGKFRIPDVMRQSGAKLVEVGTTNKTYVSDYEEAISARTGGLLRVHSSNFKVVGFTEEATIQELSDLGAWHHIPVLDDLGSGCLLDATAFGLDPEPRPQDSLAAHVGLVMFSGDKLLGGPQAGIILGQQDLVDKLKKHPLARAVRIDKSRLAALSATLIHYLKGEATAKIPIWRMIATPLAEIERRANEWATAIGELASVESGESAIGGGSLPGSTLKTSVVSIRMPSNLKVTQLAAVLRAQPFPIMGRVERNTLVLDPRTVLPEESAVLVETFRRVLSQSA